MKWPEEKEEKERERGRRAPSFWETGRVAPGSNLGISRHLTQPELDLFRILGSFNFFVSLFLCYKESSALFFYIILLNLIVYCHDHLT